MALTLDQIRTYVRSHLDLDVEDLPDALLDVWARDGSRRVESAEARWPFYEKFYLTTIPVNPSFFYLKSSFGSDLQQVASIVYPGAGFAPLQWLGYDAFQEVLSQRPGAVGRPRFFSEWGGNLVFFPAADVAYNVRVNGYRTPIDWVANGAGAVPDMPDRLHNTIATWVLSKAYAQQEDPELAAVYERQFADELNEYRRRLVITPQHQPLVLNGGTLDKQSILARPRWSWEID